MSGARHGAPAGTRAHVPVELDAFVPAAGARRAWTALDVLVLVLVPAALGVVTQLWVGVVAVVVAVTAGAVRLVRVGRTPAHRLLGLRTVDRATGLPPTVRGLLSADAATLDVRRGPDPLRFAPRPRAAAPAAHADPWSAGGDQGARAVLLLDDGTVVEVHVPTVLGRNPAPSGPDGVAVRVTDLSRTLSRSHIEVAPHDDGLQVTDLASANGTAVAQPGGAFELLAPGAAVVLPVGGRLVIGDRTIVVVDRASVEAS
jgi:hypothetical protein